MSFTITEAFVQSYKPPVRITGREPLGVTVVIVATEPYAYEEGEVPGTFTITRLHSNLLLPLTVEYTVTGTATPGDDYTVLEGTVVIPVGEESVELPVVPVDDEDIEGDETVIVTLNETADYFVGDPGSDTVTIVDNDESEEEWPFPTCAINEAVTTEQAETWYDNGAGLLPGAAGFFLAPTTIDIRRTGCISASPTNHSTGYSYKAAEITGDAEFSMPHDCVVAAVHNVSGDASIFSAWGYIFFENTPYWQTHPIQIDWLAFTGELFDPELAGGVEIWCCETPGVEPPRDDRGRDLAVWNFGGTGNSATLYAGDPVELPALTSLLYTLTAPGDLPITIPVPAGRALMFRTVNQDPQTLPPGSQIFGDINVGAPNDDPPMAYKIVKSEAPTSVTNFTTTAASRLRLRGLVRERTFAGATHAHGVLIYRDPTRATGNTLRFPITDPYLWFGEDPEDTFIGAGVTATLTAYAVDEAFLIGNSAADWALVKTWNYVVIELLLGSVLETMDFETSSENAFATGGGNFDVDMSGDRKLVYYKFTTSALTGVPGAGVHIPSILHGNASIF